MSINSRKRHKTEHPTSVAKIEILSTIYISEKETGASFIDVKNSVLPRCRSAAINRSPCA